MSYAEDGSVLWVWQVQEADGRWGTITMGAQFGVGGPVITTDVLVHRTERVARGDMQAIAERHRQMSGKPIRLSRFHLEEVVEHRRGAAHG